MNLIDLITTSFGWALIHSIWQILFVGFVLKIFLLVYKKSNPAIKYNIILGGLGSILFLFGVTFYTILNNNINPGLQTTPFDAHLSPLEVSSEYSLSNIPAGNLQSSGFDSFIRFINNSTLHIALAWAIGFIIFLLRFFGGYITIFRLKNFYSKPISKKWQETTQRIQSTFGIRRSVQLMESAFTKIPMVIGQLKPVIILPMGLVTHIPYNQLEAILVHEMAHIKRNDYLVNLMITLMEAVFFYHPAFWWMSRLLEEQRENACDDMTISYCGNPVPLQKALIDLSGYNQKLQHIAAALYKNDNQLLKRIKRMKTKTQKNHEKRFKPLSSLILLAGFFILIAGSSFVPRQNDMLFGLLQPKENDKISPAIDLSPVIYSNVSKTMEILQSKPDTVKDTKKNKTGDIQGNAVISIELDENGNLINVKKDGQVLSGEERKKYEKFAMEMNTLQKEEKMIAKNQQELDELKIHLKETQKQMQVIQSEYEKTMQEYIALKNEAMIPSSKDAWSFYENQWEVSREMKEAMQKEQELAWSYYNSDQFFEQDNSQDQWADMRADAFEKQHALSEKYIEDMMNQQKMNQMLEKDEITRQMEQIKELQKVQQIEMDHMLFESRIYKELQKDKLMEKGDKVSFELSKKRLVVNGKKQPADLHEKYLKIYNSYADKPLSGETKVMISD